MDKSPDAFRTISEVADWLEVPAHVLRFWESRFTQIKPVKRAGGRRYYRPADIALLAGIKKLLHDDGLTIRGVQKILREDGVRHVAGLVPHALSDAEADGATGAPPMGVPDDDMSLPAQVLSFPGTARRRDDSQPAFDFGLSGAREPDEADDDTPAAAPPSPDAPPERAEPSPPERETGGPSDTPADPVVPTAADLPNPFADPQDADAPAAAAPPPARSPGHMPGPDPFAPDPNANLAADPAPAADAPPSSGDDPAPQDPTASAGTPAVDLKQLPPEPPETGADAVPRLAVLRLRPALRAAIAADPDRVAALVDRARAQLAAVAGRGD